jgi:hypothetical protein
MVTRPVVNGVATAAGVGADDVSGGGAASFSEMVTLHDVALPIFHKGLELKLLAGGHKF